jgi:hypothetical protein
MIIPVREEGFKMMLASLIVTVSGCVGFNAEESGHAAQAQAVRTAYEANLSSLTFGTIRFRFARGKVRNPEAARAGE